MRLMIMEPIRVELTRQDIAEKWARANALEQIHDHLGQASVAIRKDLMDFAGGILDDPACQLFMLDSSHSLKHMAERPVPQIMQQRSSQASQLLSFVDFHRSAQLREHLARRLHNP